MSEIDDGRVVVAIDIGGTRIKAALVEPSFTVVSESVTPTPPDLASRLGEVVAEVTAQMLDERAAAGAPVQVVAGGVVVPGIVDAGEGIARYSANLGWRDLPLRAIVEERLGVVTAIGHDVRAGLIAESRLGAAQGRRHALFMPVGTGIAGALMLDGHVIDVGGYAGEVGHVAVRPDGPRCACGRRGCLEAVASASAIERIHAERTGTARTAEQIAHLVNDGDVAARAVWDEAVGALADAVVATVTTTGVDVVVVGGGLAQSGDTLLVPLREAVRQRLTFERPVTITAASLGDRAGALGAACLAWDAA